MLSNWMNEWKAGWHGSAPSTGHSTADVLLALAVIVIVLYLGAGVLRRSS